MASFDAGKSIIMTEEQLNSMPNMATGSGKNEPIRTRTAKREQVKERPFKVSRILVPTDYSDNADKALFLAVKIAKEFAADILVVHTYHMPFTDEHMPPDMVKELLDAQKMRADAEMKEYAEKHASVDPATKVEYRAVMGFAAEAILDIARHEQTDLIVLGTKGANSIEDRMFGTVTWNIIKKSDIPVVALPSVKDPVSIKNVMVPFEGTEQDYDIISYLLGFAAKFNATVHAVHFMQDNNAYNKSLIDKLQTGFRKDIEAERLQLHFLAEKNITEGIKKFATRNNIDMIGMVTHNHGLFSTIFHMSVTRNIALYSQIPLLAYNCDKL